MPRKHKSDWQPTKYVLRGGRWRGSGGESLSSRLIMDLQVAAYTAAIARYAKGRLADLGCGNAPLAGAYAPLVDDYVWADWPNSLHQIFQLDEDIDLNGTLPFGERSFDTLLLTDVLEHIAEPDRLLAQLARILKPGGHLIVGVPFLYQIHEDPHDYHRYTKYKLADFAAKHGLEVVSIDEIGGGFDALADISGKLYGKLWKPLAALPYYLWSALREISFIRKLNNKLAQRLPLAYIAVYRRPDGG